MNTGKLRHYISIEEKQISKNPYGESIETWVPKFSLWAEVKPLRTAEYLEANRSDLRLTHRIVMRYKEGIGGRERVIFEGRVFEITEVRNYFEKNSVLEILAREIVDG